MVAAAARGVAAVALPPLVLRIFDLEKGDQIVQGEQVKMEADAEVVDDGKVFCIL